MAIDSTTSVVALVSGLIGALLTAFLNYKIRQRISKEEEAKKKKALAHVYFLQLTDSVAAQFLLKNIFEKLSPHFENLKSELCGGGEKFDVDHAISAFLANALIKLDKSKTQQLRIIVPFLELIDNFLDKVFLSEEKLAELPQESVYFYNRYMRFTYQLKVNLAFIKTAIENDNLKILDEKVIHGMWINLKRYFSAAGVLRAAFIQYGGINVDYAFRALCRSYDEFRKEFAQSFIDSPKLDEAKVYISKKDANGS